MFNKKVNISLLLVLVICLCSYIAHSNNQKINKNIIKEQRVASGYDSQFQSLNMKTSDINIKFENTPFHLDLPIYTENNRYYFPLSEIIPKLQGTITVNDQTYLIHVRDNVIKFTANSLEANCNNTKINFKKNIIISGNTVYIDLYDLTKILDLKTKWSHADKSLNFYFNKEILMQKPQKNSEKIAAVRLEDIGAGGRYSTAESLEKLRALADYLFTEGIPFSVAWVPKYVEPLNNISNDPTENINIFNSDFLFTLDYFIDRGGSIGLHGYTHQFKNEPSIVGTEFSSKVNNDEKNTRERLQLALGIAKKLDVPISFFESPHYAATAMQHKIMGEYFDTIYEHAFSNKEKTVTFMDYNNKKVRFIPTPLNYLDGKEDLDNMLCKIQGLNSKTLGSFFFHPNIEFEFITIKNDDHSYPTILYDKNSPMHQIINALQSKGYEFKLFQNIK